MTFRSDALAGQHIIISGGVGAIGGVEPPLHLIAMHSSGARVAEKPLEGRPAHRYALPPSEQVHVKRRG